jgi:hypothetical protein
MPVDATGMPVPAPPAGSTGTAGAPAQNAPADAEQAPAKKRGFWSRVFGGREKKDEDTKKDEPKKKSGG